MQMLQKKSFHVAIILKVQNFSRREETATTPYQTVQANGAFTSVINMLAFSCNFWYYLCFNITLILAGGNFEGRRSRISACLWGYLWTPLLGPLKCGHLYIQATLKSSNVHHSLL